MLTPQNGQTHSNNSPAVADELFECVWPFCGIGTSRVNFKNIKGGWKSMCRKVQSWSYDFLIEKLTQKSNHGFPKTPRATDFIFSLL